MIEAIFDEKHAYVRQVVPGDELPDPPAIAEDEGIRQQPADDGGGGSTSYEPFELVAADEGGSNKVRVVSGEIAGDVPSGFSPGDDPPYILDVSDGDIVWAIVTYDVSSGEGSFPVTSRTLDKGSSLPADDPTAGTFYYRIGSVAIVSGKTKPVNDRTGAILTNCFRLWYEYPKNFGVDGR